MPRAHGARIIQSWTSSAAISGVSAAGVAGALAIIAGRRTRRTAHPRHSGTPRNTASARAAGDQTKALQRAIDEVTRAQLPLALPPGIYRTGLLRLQGGSLIGVRGATKFVFNGGIDSAKRRRPAASVCQASPSTAAASRCRCGAVSLLRRSATSASPTGNHASGGNGSG